MVSKRPTTLSAKQLRDDKDVTPKKREGFLEKLEKERSSLQIRRLTTASGNWFKNRMKDLDPDGSFNRLKQDAKRRNQILEREPGVGFIYTYKYQAKLDGKLPYWDRHPLIILVGPAEGGWYGLNLHYLPPKRRAVLLDKLAEINDDTRLTARTKIKVSYQLLSKASSLPEFKPCFKRYLKSQLKSPIVKIPAQEWEAVLYMPLQKFKGASSQKVWSDSLKNARK